MNQTSSLTSSQSFDTFALRSLALLLVLQMTNTTVKSLMIETDSDLITILLGAVFLIYLLLHLRQVKAVAITQLLLLESLFVTLYMLSAIRYPEATQAIFYRGGWTCLYCIPIGVLVFNMSQYTLLLSERLRIPMLILLLEGCLVFAVRTFEYADISGLQDYDMSIGYMLLYPACFFYYHVRSQKLYILPLVLSLFIIIVFGSRGPLLCFMSFVLLSFLRKQSLRKIGWLLFWGVLFLIFYINKEAIADSLFAFLEQMGIHSRTLYKMSQGVESAIYLSGRELIWEETQQHIFEKPLWGWGISGELSYMVTYPHSIYLEILLHYGILFGGIILIALTYLLVKAYFAKKIPYSILNVFLATGLVPLFLSSSYLIEYKVWILVALCLKSLSIQLSESRK